MKKALYGLKQAPITWYNCIDTYHIKIAFCRSRDEPTLYTKTHEDKILIVCLYVDDLLYISNMMLGDFKTEIKTDFDMTDVAVMKYFLGIEIH